MGDHYDVFASILGLGALPGVRVRRGKPINPNHKADPAKKRRRKMAEASRRKNRK